MKRANVVAADFGRPYTNDRLTEIVSLGIAQEGECTSEAKETRTK